MLIAVLILCLSITAACSGFDVNITLAENCPDQVADVPVLLYNVTYEREENLESERDRLIDTFHGEYEVKEIDITPRTLRITLSLCTDNDNACLSRPRVYTRELQCDAFKEDASGPWHMFSQAMSGAHCGEESGLFLLRGATLRPEYLKDYIPDEVVGTDPEHYRMRLEFISEMAALRNTLRACVDVHFRIIR